MTEDFLHYVWKFRKFNIASLRTVDGEEVNPVDMGMHNHNSGPDFNNARLYINRQLWAGNVEIHIRSSDWYRHKHQDDPAYANIILHVVYEDDQPVRNAAGVKIPTLELKGRLDEKLYWQYEHLLNNPTTIPCASQLDRVNSVHINSMLERVWVERMENKSEVLADILKKNKGDWNETFYQWICRAYGLKVNADPMLMLSRNLPLKTLLKHRDSMFQMEAILLGVAGFVDETPDEYTGRLKQEYTFLQKKYKLNQLDSTIWKFSRLRPAAFPTLRLAKFAAFVRSYDGLLSKILSVSGMEDMKNLFRVSCSEYWQKHYRPGKPVRKFSGSTGEAFIDLLIINVIVPFFFLYGKVKGQKIFREKALKLLEELQAENNQTSRMYAKLQFPMNSALDSQSVIQLNSFYCKPKKCLNCAIGTQLLK